MNRWTWMIGLLWTAGAAAVGAAGLAQENTSAPLVQVASGDVVPAVIRYSGALPGQAQERESVRFSIYAEATGGSALWTESQTVITDKDGKYAVLLGSSSSIGLPKEVFTDGQARWLGIQIGSGEEQRSLLASVPFAMKAGDASTLAGKSVAEFVTTDQLRAQVEAEVAAQALTAKAAAVQPMAAVAAPTGSGTSGYIPMWSAASALADSVIYQTASSTGTRVGFGTTSPGSTIDVNGYATVRGGIQLQSNPGTASTGENSPTLDLIGSTYSSSSSAAVPQRFRWQVDVSGNDTASPSANLVLGYGTTSASATGLSISPKGIITFAPGQTFPGAAGGNSTTINAASYDLGGALFAFGSASQANAFLGFSGNRSTASSSIYNTGAGDGALYSLSTGQSNSSFGSGSLSKNTTGNSNTAVGFYALDYNTSGSNNTAVGVEALEWGTAGSGNTAVGAQSGPSYSTSSLSNATAIGANATVSQSNSLILGQTSAGSPGASHVNVGIGTATPATTMEISVNAPNTLGPTLLLTNPGGTTASAGPGQAAQASIDFKTYLHASTQNSPTSRIEAVDDNYGNQLVFQAKIPGSDSNPLANAMTLQTGPGGWNTMENPLIVVYYNGVPDNRPAAEFGGDISVDGTVSADAKDFKIDHPSDPANKYLQHTSVESSEMMNIYSGNVTTDELGVATITLPDWFEAENGDFRYQLTAVGRDAHAWIAQEVTNHQFKIASNATFVKISWQITAVRQDAYAKAHPLVVEQQKPVQERGFYRHPELYGQAQEKSVQWARHSKQMQRMKSQQLAAGTAVAKAQQQ
jgi:trimeric autotransporter adhesin